MGSRPPSEPWTQRALFSAGARGERCSARGFDQDPAICARRALVPMIILWSQPIHQGPLQARG